MDKIEKKCCICGTHVAQYWQDILNFETKYSGTPIFKMLEMITHLEMFSVITDDIVFVCDCCLIKIEEYDLARYTVRKIEKEILSMLNHVEGNEEVIEQTIKCEVIDEFIEIEKPPDNNHIHTFVAKSQNSPKIYTIDNSIKSKKTVELSAKQKEKAVSIRSSRASRRSKEPVISYEILENSTKVKSGNRRSWTPMKCGKCFQEFLAKSEYKLHLKIHEDEAKVICYQCGAIYKSKSALAIHMGIHNGVSPYECKICQKKFTQKGALVRHMPLHTGEKPYQCEKCGKQFIHYSSFHMHQLSHDDVRDKKCSICGLLLRSTSHLSRHMRVHSGEKPHACPVCGQKFAQRYNMTSHYKTHMGIHRKHTKTFECTICVQEFKYKKALIEHMRAVHEIMDNAFVMHSSVKNVTATTTVETDVR